MKRIILFASVFLAFVNHTFSKKSTAPVLSRLFIENRGQITEHDGKPRPDIYFMLRDESMSLFVTSTGLHYQFSKWQKAQALPLKDTTELPYQINLHRLEMELVGANRHAEVVKQEQQEYYENYYNIIGKPDGVAFVHTYTRLTYKDIYPHIDWELYVKDNEVKYDFIVHPGGDAGQIKLRYKGADDAQLQADGSVTFTTQLGQVNEMPPVSWVGKEQNGVGSTYHLTREGQDYFLSFQLSGLPPASGYTLTIDPVLMWSSYYAGSIDEVLRGTTCDIDGNILFAGTSSSGSLATSGTFSSTIYGYLDAILVKFTPNQTRLWGTYYGGTLRDEFYCVAVNGSNNIFAAGETRSNNNIATANAHKTVANSNSMCEGILVAFTSSGNLIWGTYFGGSDDEHICGIAINRDDQIFIAGQTLSTDGIASALPGNFVLMSGATTIYPSPYYSGPAFIASFNKYGKKLWGTYYGDGFHFVASNFLSPKCVDITCDNAGYVYFTGFSWPATNNAPLYTQNAFQSTYGGYYEGCLAKFKPNGQRLWGTLIGGAGNDYVHGIACDDSANVYICGETGSTGLAFNGWQSSFSGQNTGLVAKYDSTGKRVWFTYLGGPSNYEYELSLYGVQADEKGNVLVGGFTSNNFGYQPFTSGGAGTDFIMARFTSNGALKWCTPKGGEARDNIWDVSLDNEGGVYACGLTTSSTGIAYNAYQATYGGGTNTFDGVMMKIQYDTLKLIRPLMNKSEYCHGDSAWVKFKVNAAFNVNDTFRIELSNNVGIFVNTTLLGVKRYTATGIDSIKVGLPSGLTQNGYYRVRVVVTSTADTSFASAIFVIQVPLSAVITPGTKTAICQGTAVILSVPSEAFAYRWQKNGVNTASAGDTLNSILVNQAGTYRVKLTTSAGCVSYSGDTTVTVNPYPVANIKVNNVTQCFRNNLFKVTDSSTISSGNIAIRLWTLGDSITATSIDTQRYFSKPGTYTITLVVTSAIGCSKSASIPVTVYPQPEARLFQTSPAGQCLTGNSFTLKDSSRIDSGYNISTMQLYMGNGSMFTTGNKVYSYAQPGDYTILLKVSSNNGCVDSSVEQVHVFPQPATYFNINDSTQCKTGNAFVCTNTSTISTGNLVSYTWQSGDGFTFNTQNLTHSYLNPGTYAITLKAVSDQGCKDSMDKVIDVYPQPMASFTINSDTQCVLGNSYVFTNTSSVWAGFNISAHQWNLGDTQTDTTKHSVHVYAQAGGYAVKLLVTSNSGCRDSVVRNIFVKTSPLKPVVTKNQFTLTSTSASAYQWLLNGTVLNGATTQNHTATQNGYYQVHITEANGCSNVSDSTFIGNVSAPQVSSVSGIVLYPNPTTGTFTLTWPGKEKATVVIYGSKGEEVAVVEAFSSEQTWALPAGCGPGVYWIKVSSKDFNRIIKLVKW